MLPQPTMARRTVSTNARSPLRSTGTCGASDVGHPAPTPSPSQPAADAGEASARSGGEEVGEVLLGRDLPARQAEAEGLGGEHVDLRAVLLEAVRVEVVAHHGRRLLELRLEPRRRVGEPLLGGGEAVVARDESLGEAPGDPRVRLPRLT